MERKQPDTGALPLAQHAPDCPRSKGWWKGEATPPCTCGGRAAPMKRGGDHGDRH